MQALTNDDPRHVGPFRIIGVLGTGGMGRVYLGRDTDGRTVAVKTARRELADDGHFRKRFAREVAAAQRVGGRFVAQVVAAAPHVDVPWMATEYVPGLSLSTTLDRYGPLPEDAVELLASGLLRALSAVHAQGLVHRDLKPSNIILTADGPRVIDFGVARSTIDTTLTTTGTVLGTPGYMAPEQLTATGPELTGAADIFALGGVLVFATTGNGPFGSGHPHVLMYRAMHEEPELEKVPDTLLHTAAACLDKAPDERPTMAALLTHFGTPLCDDWLPGPLATELRRLSTQLDDIEDMEGAPVADRKGASLSSAPETSGAAPGPQDPDWSPRPVTQPAASKLSRRRVLTALSFAGVAAGGGALAWGLWPEGEPAADAAAGAAADTGEPAFELPRGSRKIDAVMPVPDGTGDSWLFTGDSYLQVRTSSSSSAAYPVRTVLEGPFPLGDWKDTLGRKDFRGGIDAVMPVPGGGAEYWVFSGNTYLRLRVPEGGPEGEELLEGPAPVGEWADAFGGLRLTSGIDAVMPVPDEPYKYWVFARDKYIRMRLDGTGGPQDGVPSDLREFSTWSFGKQFPDGIDAAMPLPEKQNDYWVFSGDRCMKVRVRDRDYQDQVLQEPIKLRTQPAPESS